MLPPADAGHRCRLPLPSVDAGHLCRLSLPSVDAGQRCRLSMPPVDAGHRCKRATLQGIRRSDPLDVIKMLLCNIVKTNNRRRDRLWELFGMFRRMQR